MFWESKKVIAKREYSKVDLISLSVFYFKVISHNINNPTEMSKFIGDELTRFKPSEIAEFVSHYIQDIDATKDKRSIDRIVDEDLIGDFKNLMNQYWNRKHKRKIYN